MSHVRSCGLALGALLAIGLTIAPAAAVVRNWRRGGSLAG